MIRRRLKEVKEKINRGEIKAYLPTDLSEEPYPIIAVSDEWWVRCGNSDYPVSFYCAPDTIVLVEVKK